MKIYRHTTIYKQYTKTIEHADGRHSDPKYRMTPWLTETAEEIEEYRNDVPRIVRFLSCASERISKWYIMKVITELYHAPSTTESLGIFLEAVDIHMRLTVADVKQNGSKPSTDTWCFNRLVSYPHPQREIAIFMAFNRWKQAAWLGKQWLSNRGELSISKCGSAKLVTREEYKAMAAQPLKSSGMFGDWIVQPFTGYMGRLHLIQTEGADPCGKFPDLPAPGPYAGLFRHWNEPEKLPKAILAACQYHLDQCRAPDKGTARWMTEFYFPPFDAIPLEIIAYRSLREKMGLETPFPSHPILDTPFVANLPKKVPRATDPLLDRIVAAVNKHYPDILK